MGSFSSKTKSKSDPYAPAIPAIQTGLTQVQDINAQQQPRLNDMANVLQNGFGTIANTAFGANPLVTAAQGTAANFANGSYSGTNPGASTYSRLMQPANDPSMGIIQGLASGTKSPGSYDGFGGSNPANSLLASLASGSGGWSEGANPGDAFASKVAGGGYLGSQQSNQFYSDTLGGKYLNANPYLDKIVGQSNETARNAVSDRFAQSGLGEGVSSAYVGTLGKSLADSENALRYGAYNDELSRMGQIAGQSDSVWSGERGRMDASTGQLSSNFNAAQDRALSARNSDNATRLSAATSLGGLYDTGQNRALDAQQAKDSAFNADRSAQLGAATQLGQRYDAGNATQMGAAQAADGAHNNDLQQILQSLGLTGQLTQAQYAGVSPALQLAQGAATLPFAGTSQYADILKSLTGGYGTTTGTTSQSLGSVAAGLAGAGLAGWASGGFSKIGG